MIEYKLNKSKVRFLCLSLGFLFMIAGCKTSSPEIRPGYLSIPDHYPVHFSIDMLQMQDVCTKVLTESDLPETLLKKICNAQRMWGGASRTQYSVILEGTGSSFLLGLGLTLSSSWKQIENCDYWKNEVGQEIVSFGNKIYYSNGDMDSLMELDRPTGKIPVTPVSLSKGEILSNGAMVICGEGVESIEEFLPRIGLANLTSWYLTINRTAYDYVGEIVFTLENDNVARVLKTALKLILIPYRSNNELMTAVQTAEQNILESLSLAEIDSVENRVIITGIIITKEEMVNMIKSFLIQENKGE